jgi:hypothetical protein
MRKGLFFWGILLAVGGILVAGAAYWGKPTSSVSEDGVLPPFFEAGGPWLLLQAEGTQIPTLLPEVLEEVGNFSDFGGREVLFEHPLVNITDMLRRFLLLARFWGRFGAFAEWHEGTAQMGFVAFLSDEDCAALAQGRVPARWNVSLPELEIQVNSDTGNREMRLKKGSLLTIFLDLRKDLLVGASSPDLLERAFSLLRGTISSPKPAWKLHPEWRGHLRGGDAGLFASSEGEAPAETAIEAAWMTEDGKGRLVWMFEGPGLKLDSAWEAAFVPREWTEAMLLPEPFFAAAGGMIPEYALAAEHPSVMELVRSLERLGLTSADAGALLTGPILFGVGGRAQYLSLPAPAFVAQFPGRGEVGMGFAKRFWRQGPFLFLPDPEPLEGFSEGGTSSVPFSLVVAASPDMAVLGVAERESLARGVFPAELVPELKNEKALLWACCDVAALYEGLSGLQAAGRVGEQLGLRRSENMNTIIRLLEKLRPVKRIVFLLFTLGKGMLSWNLPES